MDEAQELRRRQICINASTKSSSWKMGREPAFQSFCPLRTPIPRRAQTAAVAWHISGFAILVSCYLYSLANPMLWIISIPYTIYYIFDRTPGNGGVVSRVSPWFKSLPLWKRYCEYFPITLVKTADLKPTFTPKVQKQVEHCGGWFCQKYNSPAYDRTGPRYIFGYHPHGVGCLGAFGVFGTEGCNWSKLFPGIPVSLLTLVTQFHFPFYREYLMALGISAVSRKNSLKTLENDHSICIVVGGARESLLKGVGTVDLVLNRRKGFVRLALEAGNVCIVPTFAFGETDCYNIVEPKEASFGRKWQIWMKNNWGFTVPLFYARGLFNYDFGLLPYRKPITVVVGKPIYVKERREEPPPDLLDYYHNLYMKGLKELFYENRDKFGYSNVELNIVS